MKRAFLLLVLFFLNIYSQQITVLNRNNIAPLQNVLVYKNNTYIGVTNIDGKILLENKFTQSDTLTFNKNNFETLKLLHNELNNSIMMDSIKYKNIETVNIIKFDKIKLLEKIKEKINQKYTLPSHYEIFFQQFNSLSVNKKKLLYYNDLFVANEKGYFSNVLSNNFYADFKVVTRNDNKYFQKYLKFSNKYIFSRSFTCGVGQSLNNNYLLNNLFFSPKKYSIESYANFDGSKIIIMISGKDVEGRLVVDSKDYGIYEFNYKRKNFNEKSDSFFDEKTQKYYFFDETENYSFNKVNNVYILNDYSTIISFKNLNYGDTFRFESQKNMIEKFDSHNLKKVNLCDLN